MRTTHTTHWRSCRRFARSCSASSSVTYASSSTVTIPVALGRTAAVRAQCGSLPTSTSRPPSRRSCAASLSIANVVLLSPLSEATPPPAPRLLGPLGAAPPYLWYTSSTIGSAGSPARQYAFFPSYRDAGERRAVLTGSSRFPPGRSVPPRSHAGVAQEGYFFVHVRTVSKPCRRKPAFVRRFPAEQCVTEGARRHGDLRSHSYPGRGAAAPARWP